MQLSSSLLRNMIASVREVAASIGVVAQAEEPMRLGRGVMLQMEMRVEEWNGVWGDQIGRFRQNVSKPHVIMNGKKVRRVSGSSEDRPTCKQCQGRNGIEH